MRHGATGATGATTKTHGDEIRERVRFAFGQNWARYLDSLDEAKIGQAETSLIAMLGTSDLRGKSFLDAGSGSGVFSLVARRLGAKVSSFDYDPESVACTAELKRRYFENDAEWTVQEGSLLDRDFLSRLGTFDVVYSWGVLHHTGAMWNAIRNIDSSVGPHGTLFIALYNDQGRASNMWRLTKMAYVSLPRALRFIVLWPCLVRLWGPTTIRDFLRLRPFATWRKYRANRGMSPYRDVVDWVGGYPFEVCKPEQVFNFFRAAGYNLQALKTCAGGHGCNEFVFKRGS